MTSQLRGSQMISTQMNTDNPRTTTGIGVDQSITQLQELYETINIMSNGAKTLNEDTQRLNTELLEQQMNLPSLIEKFSKVKLADEETTVFVQGIKPSQDILNQDLASLKEKMDDMQYVSYDCSFTWKITNFHEKMSK